MTTPAPVHEDGKPCPYPNAHDTKCLSVDELRKRLHVLCQATTAFERGWIIEAADRLKALSDIQALGGRDAVIEECAKVCEKSPAFGQYPCTEDGVPVTFNRGPKDFAATLRALKSSPAAESGCVRVPQSAIDWLMGEGDDFEPSPDAPVSRLGHGRYWWRSEFRKRAGLSAAKPPKAKREE